MISGKIWGTTETIEANPSLEFHRIAIKAGGVCSKHIHKHKWNGFYVVSGKLQLSVWKSNYDLIDVTILEAGQYTKIAPGEYHQFEALEDTEAFEIYWVEFNHDDIQRESSGYMLK